MPSMSPCSFRQFVRKKIQYWLRNRTAIEIAASCKKIKEYDVKSGKIFFCARLYRILRHVMVFVVMEKR